ncbi:unnamed protein product [Lactuca saligna]|uniref:Uncharacterized protein n=1 Tax=Lactuca saligna TaxID=75948 RepID=A0AA35ZTP3_LACSI|nr:unnamed protein product [Lactuca saligna]
MDKSKPDQSPGKKETEPLVQTEKHQTQNKETHGLRDDIDANTPVSDVKGPNAFERLKEEIEAIAESIHQGRDKHQDSPSSIQRGDTTFTGTPSKLKIENLQVQAGTHKEKSPHHKETHGRGEEIDVNTPISEFKGPSIFHRAKEEIEAIVDTMNTKKESEREAASPKKEGSFQVKLSKVKVENLKGEAETSKEKSPHHKETHGRGEDIDVNTPISEFKGPSIFHRAKEEFEAIVDTINTKKESSSPRKEGGLRAKMSKLKIDNVKVQGETNKDKSPMSHHKETHGRGDEIDVNTPISEFKGPSIFHRAKEEIEAIVDSIQSKKESDASPKKEGGFRASVSKKLQRVYSKGRNRD